MPSITSTPFSRSDCSTSSDANGSSRAIRRSPRSISVTCEPNELYACAISTPTTPPPRIASRAGTSFAVVASRFVHGSASRSPSIGGISGELPVATTTAFRATSVSSPATTRRSPSSRPGARTTVTFRCSSHGTWLESSRLWMISSRRRSTAPASRSPVTASAHARDAARLRRAARPAAASPSTACTRRRSTRRRSGATPRSPPRARPRRAGPRTPLRPGPAPITTTSNSRSLMRRTVLCGHGHRRHAAEAGPRRQPQALHLHRGARPAAGVDPRVRDEGARAARRGVGGDDVPRLGVHAHGRAGLPRPLVSRGVRRPGRRLLLQPRAGRGDDPLELGRPRDGRGRAHRHGDAAGLQVRHRGAEAGVPRAGHPRREDLLPRHHRARRRAATWPASRPAPCATAATG